MKKLTKFLFYSAIIASAVFIVSCSDDVVDSNTTKDSGIPFKVSATVNNSGTRASDITSLSNFQIWGFTGDATNELAGVNCTLASGGGYVPATTVNWPDANTSYTFYAVSNNTNTLSANISNNDIAGISHSFDYTMPYTEVDGKNVVTNASQEDLLAAAASGKSATGVTLPFDHVFTAGKLRISIDPSKTPYGDAFKDFSTQSNIVCKIRKIIIHNVKVSGTYNAVTKTWDTTNGTLGNYVIDFTDNPLFIHRATADGTYEALLDVDGNNGNLYFIPQTIDYWNIVPNTSGTNVSDVGGTNGEQSYIEFDAITMGYYSEDLEMALDDVVASSNSNWTKNANGDFLYNGEIVVAKNSETGNLVIQDFECAGWTIATLQGLAQYETYKNWGQTKPIVYFSQINDDDFYSTFFTPFKPTLAVNGNRIFKVNIEKGTRVEDASAVFGIGMDFE